MPKLTLVGLELGAVVGLELGALEGLELGAWGLSERHMISDKGVRVQCDIRREEKEQNMPKLTLVGLELGLGVGLGVGFGVGFGVGW